MHRAARHKPDPLDRVLRLPILAAIWAVAGAGAGIGWYSGSYALNDGLPTTAFLYAKRCTGETWSGPRPLHASTLLDAREHLKKSYPGCQIKAYRPA